MKLNLKICVLLGTTGLVSTMPLVGWADVINLGPVTIHANFDGTPSGENITFRIGGGGNNPPNQIQMLITDTGTTIYDGLNVTGTTTLSATTVVGTTSITGATTVAGTTSITGTTTINTTGTAATTIGNSTNGTTVSMAGGSSGISLANGQTNINTGVGAANTTIGATGNTTSILSNTVNIATGMQTSTISIGNEDEDTVIMATAGTASQFITNDLIANTVDGDDDVVAGTLIGNNGAASRVVANSNGQMTVVDQLDTTSGTTASMVVQNSAGNIHGLVVQETKTTLSGGINSASLTLDDRGATFSDPANGNPIQVHGVADGTAPFDAVNVRQLYSGLASVLAAAPDIRLEPGKTGFGIGVGSYGGYQAVGLGFGHMYDNGVVLTGSVARGAHSETAARASLSWTW